jgi:hypothetical protein
MTTVTRNGPYIAAALGGVLALLFSGGAATWSPVENDRTIGALDAELQTLARILPRTGPIAYLEHATRPADPDVIQTFYVTQYALAPRVLVRNMKPPFLIVIRDHAAPDDPRLNGYRLFDRVPAGHRVFIHAAP